MFVSTITVDEISSVFKKAIDGGNAEETGRIRSAIEGRVDEMDVFYSAHDDGKAFLFVFTLSYPLRRQVHCLHNL
jgi:hypothetical protein